jgi:hypothetical protein
MFAQDTPTKQTERQYRGRISKKNYLESHLFHHIPKILGSSKAMVCNLLTAQRTYYINLKRWQVHPENHPSNAGRLFIVTYHHCFVYFGIQHFLTPRSNTAKIYYKSWSECNKYPAENGYIHHVLLRFPPKQNRWIGSTLRTRKQSFQEFLISYGQSLNGVYFSTLLHFRLHFTRIFWHPIQ